MSNKVAIILLNEQQKLTAYLDALFDVQEKSQDVPGFVWRTKYYETSFQVQVLHDLLPKALDAYQVVITIRLQRPHLRLTVGYLGEDLAPESLQLPTFSSVSSFLLAWQQALAIKPSILTQTPPLVRVRELLDLAEWNDRRPPRTQIASTNQTSADSQEQQISINNLPPSTVTHHHHHQQQQSDGGDASEKTVASGHASPESVASPAAASTIDLSTDTRGPRSESERATSRDGGKDIVVDLMNKMKQLKTEGGKLDHVERKKQATSLILELARMFPSVDDEERR